MLKIRNRFLLYLMRKMRLRNEEEYIQATIKTIKEGVDISGPNLWVLAAAIFIASLGLNTNSAAVIIGAMLVSPIMGPIMGIGLGLGINDLQLINKSFRNYFVAVVISILVSSLYFYISPVREPGSELLGRTAPTVYDVLIALFGGLAGIVAGSSHLSKSNVIPGVAIATALMPPLCTVGYGIGNGNLQFAVGAMYLFFINSVFISLATYFVVRLLRYPQVQERDPVKHKRIHRSILTIIFITVVPSIYLTYHIVNKYIFERSATEFIRNEVSEDPDHFVISRKLQYNRGASSIHLTMLGKEIDSVYRSKLQQKLRKYGLGRTRLQLTQAAATGNSDKGLFENISSGMEVNTGAIQDLYKRLDSIKQSDQRRRQWDSLPVIIAREAQLKTDGLRRLSLTPSVSFDYEKNALDTVWSASVSLRRWDARKVDSLRTWLKERLKNENVRLLVE